MAANSQFAMALHVLTLLAHSDGSNLKSENIACSVNTNAVVIRRILSQLRQAGLVASQTGAAGGTKLARSAEDIALVDVYRAVCCGEVFALHSRSPNQDCPVGRGMESVLCNLQKQIDNSVGETLAKYTLRDITQMVDENQHERVLG
ncbi:MAG: Rrf2 family transcriptional regulator [Acidobacteria bacterium]|nr:Rrf2 family transcriptional regulator [Acidobacteriota bacterium]